VLLLVSRPLLRVSEDSRVFKALEVAEVEEVRGDLRWFLPMSSHLPLNSCSRLLRNYSHPLILNCCSMYCSRPRLPYLLCSRWRY